MKKKSILVFSGPSGAGKSTLIKYVLQTFDQEFGVSISCTTRPRRASEINGVDYHFVSHEQFRSLVQDDQFLEYTECYGNLYGTLKSSILDLWQTKTGCIMDIEYVGARKILEGNFVLEVNKAGILVLPPSIQELKKRLISRKSETDETIDLRILQSFNCPTIAKYDHVIINNEINYTKKEISKIVSLYI
jgi:guanylate kinase